MGSYAYLTIGGYPIKSSKNYYDRFCFRLTDRTIRQRMTSQRNSLIWSIEPDEADTEETDYVYSCSAATMRRRLELAGFNRQALEVEFKHCISERIENLQELAGLEYEWAKSYKARLDLLLEHPDLNEWLGALKVLIGRGIPPWEWEDVKAEDANPVLDLLAHMDGASDSFLSHHDTGFPCKSTESMVVACLEIMDFDAECLLDITDLVGGGWTDSFEDLVEYHQDFTTFYEVFVTSLNDMRTLLPLAEDNRTLARLLYANVITAMETYLADTLKKQVINREPIKRRFVQSSDAFKERIAVQDIFRRMEVLNEQIVQVIDQMSFHSVQKAASTFKSVLDTDFPSDKIGELIKAVEVRHDIVHRNGKTTKGQPVDVSVADVALLLELVEFTIQYIDQQVKDGLLDDIEDDE